MTINMNLVIIFGVVAVLSLTFLTRATSAIITELKFTPGLLSHDGTYHKYLIDLIRENNHKVPKKHPRILPETKINTPPLVHWILSFLPERTVVRIAPVFGAISDLIQCIVIMIFAYWVFESGFIKGIPALEGAILAGGVFALTPKLAQGRPMSSRLRLSARAPGSLFVSLALIWLIIGLRTQQLLFLLIAAVFLTAVLLSSLFSTQALFISLLGLLIVTGNIMILGVATAGIVVATVLSNGRYKNIFKSNIGTLTFYFLISEVRRLKQIPERTQTALRRAKSMNVDRTDAFSFGLYFYTHHLIGLYIQLPWLIIPLLVYIRGGQLPVELVGWLVALLVTNLIIAIPGVPGEPAHRYGEYLGPPLSILTVTGSFKLSGDRFVFVSSLITIVIIISLYTVFLIIVNAYADAKVHDYPGLRDTVEWLNQKNDTNLVLYGHRQVVFQTDHIFVGLTQDHFAEFGKIKKYIQVFGNSDLESIIQDYEVNWLVHMEDNINNILSDTSKIKPEELYSKGDILVIKVYFNDDWDIGDYPS